MGFVTLIKLETDVKMQLFKAYANPPVGCLKVSCEHVCIRVHVCLRSLLERKSKRTAVNQKCCMRGQSMTPWVSVEHEWSCHCTFKQVTLLPWKQTDYLLYHSFPWKHHHPEAAILCGVDKWLNGFIWIDASATATGTFQPSALRLKMFPQRDTDS